MNKLFTDFTDDEKEEFTEHFYDLVDLDDLETPCPWGCPWLWSHRVAKGITVREAALNFALDNFIEIQEIKDMEREEREAMEATVL